jgi:hypothetical protein
MTDNNHTRVLTLLSMGRCWKEQTPHLPSTYVGQEHGWVKPSPYYAVQFYYLVEEFVRGHHLDKANPFYWDDIILNLPGSASYDPTRPRVIKWDTTHGRMAADLVAYIDDLRASGHSVEACWAIARIISA